MLVAYFPLDQKKIFGVPEFTLNSSAMLHLKYSPRWNSPQPHAQ